MFSKIPCYIYIYIYITPVLFSRAARCNFVTLLFIYLFFPHLPPSWRLDESWITNLPKVEGRRESERSSIGTQCMMPYQCLFFSDFFLDFNKEKGFVKGLLLLLCCSCLKTLLDLTHGSQIFSLARNLIAFNYPIAFNHLTKNTKLSNVMLLWGQRNVCFCKWHAMKITYLGCDLVGHWICHTHQWCNGQGH